MEFLPRYPFQSCAERHCDGRIDADFAQSLIRTARDLYYHDPFGVELDETVYAFDSTPIDRCLDLFPWAPFRRRKSAVKIHALLDLRAAFRPVFMGLRAASSQLILK